MGNKRYEIQNYYDENFQKYKSADDDMDKGMENPIFKIINSQKSADDDMDKGMNNPIFKIINSQKNIDENRINPYPTMPAYIPPSINASNDGYYQNLKQEFTPSNNNYFYNVKQEFTPSNNDLLYQQKEEIKKKFDKFISKFPCLLKYNNDSGIEAYNSCLNKIPLQKIKFEEENKYTVNEIKSDKKTSLINNVGVSFGISVLQNDVNFKGNINNPHKYKVSSKYVVVKKILYSMSISKEDISINEVYLKKIKNIADSVDSDERKAKKLNSLLKETGFYIPLKAYIGGKLEIDTEGENEEKTKELIASFKADLDFKVFTNKNSFEIKKKFERTKTYSMLKTMKIGGDTNKKLEDWVSTVDFDNAEIIEYTEIRDITDFIDEKLKEKLEGPINKVIEIYELRGEYLRKMKELRNNKGELRYENRNDNLKIGYCQKVRGIICDESESFSVDSKTLLDGKKNVQKTIMDAAIVGIEIINNCKESKNASFTFENPILNENKKYIDITFQSRKKKGIMDFAIKIYTMKFPE